MDELVVKNVALGLDGRYGSTLELSCRFTFARISCKFGGIVIFDTLSRIGCANLEIPGGGGGVNDLVSGGLYASSQSSVTGGSSPRP